MERAAFAVLGHQVVDAERMEDRAGDVFGSDWDVMSDVTKSRQHGFHEVVDSEVMFERLLTLFRKERIVP